MFFSAEQPINKLSPSVSKRVPLWSLSIVQLKLVVAYNTKEKWQQPCGIHGQSFTATAVESSKKENNR